MQVVSPKHRTDHHQICNIRVSTFTHIRVRNAALSHAFSARRAPICALAAIKPKFVLTLRAFVDTKRNKPTEKSTSYSFCKQNLNSGSKYRFPRCAVFRVLVVWLQVFGIPASVDTDKLRKACFAGSRGKPVLRVCVCCVVVHDRVLYCSVLAVCVRGAGSR